MRLINADKLRLSAIEITHNSEFAFDNCFPYWQFSKAIREAPTVEAIPIEWIVKWAWAFMDKNTEGYKMAMELLHDWEAENEKQTVE